MAVAPRCQGKGTAAVVFASADEAREAIPLLNGTLGRWAAVGPLGDGAASGAAGMSLAMPEMRSIGKIEEEAVNRCRWM